MFAGQHHQPLFQQIIATGIAEDHGEGGRANQDSEHHGGHADRIFGGIPDHFERELAVDDRQNHGANTAQCGGFRGSGDAGEDGAQHDHDQRQWRNNRQQGIPDFLAPADRFILGRHGRCGFRLEAGQDQNVDNVQANQYHAGHDRGLEQIAHGQAKDVTQNDQDDRRRHNLAQGA